MTNNRCTASTTPMPDVLPAITYTCTKENCEGDHSAPLQWRRKDSEGIKQVEQAPGTNLFTWTDSYAREAGWSFTPAR